LAWSSESGSAGPTEADSLLQANARWRRL